MHLKKKKKKQEEQGAGAASAIISPPARFPEVSARARSERVVARLERVEAAREREELLHREQVERGPRLALARDGRAPRVELAPLRAHVGRERGARRVVVVVVALGAGAAPRRRGLGGGRHRRRDVEVLVSEVARVVQRDEQAKFPPVLQAFEGLLLDWSRPSVRIEYRDVPHLPAILRSLAANSTALGEKRQALASMWTRLLWREALPRDIARALHKAPDAFDSLMQSLWLRLNFGLRGDTAPAARPARARTRAG